MNRIVLIGNGFDLAHGLKTRYEDFINWYWDYRFQGLIDSRTNVTEDILCKMTCIEKHWTGAIFIDYKLKNSYGIDIYNHLKSNDKEYKVELSPLFERIMNSVETKRWVDIENEYYHLLKKYAIENPSDVNTKELNKQLQYLQDLLIKYLTIINQAEIETNSYINNKIYSPIRPDDICVEWRKDFKEHINWCINQESSYWIPKMERYDDRLSIADVDEYKRNYQEVYHVNYPRPFMLPDNIMLLNFNYTKTARKYHNQNFFLNYIHGELEKPNSIIFGYGDELDEDFKKLKELNDNECQRNVKSIKYLESDSYRNVLAFIESAPYQVCIMGHSCGNSDRTLLNTLFEHKNCISIKPYYYKKEDGTDNYLELVQNISRNFTDMKLMRDRVVNKTYCETLL